MTNAARLLTSDQRAGLDFRSRDTGIDHFLQAWALEFAREFAVAIREYPFVRCGRARHLQAVDSSGVLWWRAVVEGHRSFALWVGAREKTWSAAGKLNWVRLLERVQGRAIASVNPELEVSVRGGQAQVVVDAPDAEDLCYAVMGIKLARTELPALLIALEQHARDELLVREELSGPLLAERLLDLELPLSVTLGSAKLPIGEVLKITSGSVIPLHGYTGAEVEVIVHGTVVAKGQVISHKGNYGVRILEILNAGDRIRLCAPG